MIRSLPVLCFVLLLSACVTETVGPPLIKPAAPEAQLQALVDLSIGYIRNRDYNRAKENLNRALKIDPNSPQAHNAFGLVYQLEGDDEQADIHFKKATADQSYSRAFNNYGAYLFTQGRYQEAIEKLEVAANDRFYENRPLVFENLGVAYLQMNNQEAAEQAFTRATRLNPNQSRALLELAHIRYDEKNYVESRYFYRQFVGSSQQNARSLLLCVRISRIFDDTDSEASCELTLKNIFPVSEEYKQLEASK